MKILQLVRITVYYFCIFFLVEGNAETCPKNDNFVSIENTESNFPCMYSGTLRIKLPTTAQNQNLFYWLVLNEGFSEKGLLVWLGSNPGYSILNDMFKEMGPFVLQNEHEELTIEHKTNMIFLSTQMSIIFLELPSLGFSSVSNLEDITPTSLSLSVMASLQEFFRLYQETNIQFGNYFIGAEKFGAPIALHTSLLIANKQKELKKKANSDKNPSKDLYISKFAGTIIGNGYIEPKLHRPVSTDALRALGIIPKDRMNQLNYLNQECRNNAYKIEEGFESCENLYSYISAIGNIKTVHDIRNRDHSVSPDSIEKYFKDNLHKPTTQQRFHIDGEQPFYHKNTELHKLYQKSLTHSSISDLEDLLSSKIPILLYTGPYDIVCSPTSYSDLLEHLNSKSALSLNTMSFSYYMNATEKPRIPIGYFKSSENLILLILLNSSFEGSNEQLLNLVPVLQEFSTQYTLESSESSRGAVLCEGFLAKCRGKGKCESNGKCICNEENFGPSCNHELPLHDYDESLTLSNPLPMEWHYFRWKLEQGGQITLSQNTHSQTQFGIYVSLSSELPSFLHYDFMSTRGHLEIGTQDLNQNKPILIAIVLLNPKYNYNYDAEYTLSFQSFSASSVFGYIISIIILLLLSIALVVMVILIFQKLKKEKEKNKFYRFREGLASNAEEIKRNL